METGVLFRRPRGWAVVLVWLAASSCAATRPQPRAPTERPESLFGVLLGGRSLDDEVAGTELDIFGIETDADYAQLAAVFAWGG